MSNNFSLDQLTEGIRQRHLGTQNRRLIEKWSRTGLLRGLAGTKRENMALMLENQAAQLLRERNAIGGGSGGGTSNNTLRGFTNIAFPIVRRVFGGLVANELVSIQPMSLPSGLLFYLDYTYGTLHGQASGGQGSNDNVMYSTGSSIYNSPAGKNVQFGSDAVGGQYDLAGTGYSRVRKASAKLIHTNATGNHSLATGLVGYGGSYEAGSLVATANLSFTVAGSVTQADVDENLRLIEFDPQIKLLVDDGSADFCVMFIPTNEDAAGTGVDTVTSQTSLAQADLTMIKVYTGQRPARRSLLRRSTPSTTLSRFRTASCTT
jgi:hypothetical protein